MQKGFNSYRSPNRSLQFAVTKGQELWSSLTPLDHVCILAKINWQLATCN